MQQFPMITTEAEGKAFRASVLKYVKKQKKYNSTQQQKADILFYTSHAIHVLHTLTIKRYSLSNAIEAFGEISQACAALIASIIQQSEKNKNNHRDLKSLQEVLQHFFIQYIHIRDGMILLTSGECRHIADSKMAKSKESNKFPSQLTEKITTRRDGYTQLYSSNCGYSGYGWDEFHNEEVGIKKRLLESLRLLSLSRNIIMEEGDTKQAELKRNKIWDKLLDYGAQGFDSTFDIHENIMKDLQRNLENKRMKFTATVEKILSSSQLFKKGKSVGGGKLVMVTEDKFEKLELTNAQSFGVDKIAIQRQGDAFKGNDKRGSLPNNASKVEWGKIMKFSSRLAAIKNNIENRNNRSNRARDCSTKSSLPDRLKKKKLLVIEDDTDDDSENECNEVNTSCLKVTVEKTQHTSNDIDSKKAEVNSSLHDIKRQMGVDVQKLQQAREDLEAEEKVSKETAYADEIGELEGGYSLLNENQNQHLTVEMYELHDLIMEGKEDVKLYRGVCNRKSGKDDDEAWDARESLRHSLMNLGNLQVEYHEISADKGDFYLKEAELCFEEAVVIVQELERINRKHTVTSESESQVKFRTRALLLCRGRALINLGRTYFERTERAPKLLLNKIKDVLKPNRHVNDSVLLGKAVKCLKNAEYSASSLRAQAVTMASEENAAERHKLEADDLESLACRWKGHALWGLSKREDSIKAFRKAAGKCDDIDNFNSNSIEILSAKIELLIQQYHSAGTLVTAATSAIGPPLRSSDGTENDEHFFHVACEGYDRAANISKILATLTKCKESPITYECLLCDHEIVSSEEVINMRDKAVTEWKERNTKECDTSELPITNEIKTFHLPRNDIFSNGNLYPKRTSSHSKVVSAQPKGHERKSKKRKGSLIGPQDDAFDNFGILTGRENTPLQNEGDQEAPITYRLWGDELLIASGKSPNAYPACEPERPPEMIRELQGTQALSQ